MSIEALKLIPQELFDEMAFDQEITEKYKLPAGGAAEALKTMLKLMNPVRVNGAGDNQIKTLFRDTVFKNHHTLSGSIRELTTAELSDATGTLTDKGLEVLKTIAAKYKGVEGELAY